jgi:hypothetical protein
MPRGRTSPLHVLAGIVVVLCVRPARAADSSCSPMAIEADASVMARWPVLLKRVREAFDARDDVDRCARVELTSRDASISAAVVLPDGRSASRSVSQGEDVVPTLEALLLLPLEPEATPPPTIEPPPPLLVPSAPVVNTATQATPTISGDDMSARSRGSPPGHVRVELSLATSARIGDGQTGVGLGALSFLEVADWLVGFAGELDRYQVIASGPPVATLQLAALGGRRFRFGSLALDLVVGPAVALQGDSTISKAKVASGGIVNTTSVSTSSEGSVPRLLLGARLNFGARSAVRTFVGIDGELGPSRAGDGGDLPVVPRLPAWTLGLALGATVGTQ